MIRTYHDLAREEVIGPVDVCVIGSGAGGSVMAYYLAKAGFKVAVLEKGGWFPPRERGRREVYMLTRIQAMTIFTPAEGEHTRVSLIAGECVGGGTVASESVTWDLPLTVREDWERMGLASFGPGNQKISEYQEELHRKLDVRPVPREDHNPCNQAAMIGAQREDLRWKSVDRPVRGCRRCGNCTQGCRYGAKRDAERTFIRWARRRGAMVFAGAEAVRLKVNFPEAEDEPFAARLRSARGSAREDILRELEKRRLSSPAKFTVEARVTDRKSPPPRGGPPDSKTLIVHARQVALAAGPAGTSRLLLRSGLNPRGVVGRGFSLHPTAFNLARFDRSVMLKGWDGINDTIEIHHFGDMFRNEPYYEPERHGFLLEAALSLPWGMANLLPGTGAAHLELMRDMNHFAGLEVQLKSDRQGRIHEDRIAFDISERDNEALLFGTWIAARIFFRAGAKEVFTGLPGLVLRSPRELGRIFEYRRGKRKGYMFKQANLYTGHLFGGAAMGKDPRASFADETGECHAVKGLWVADGSAFPTNVGVNCCLSIMTVARKTADHFIEKNRRSAG